MHKRVLLVEASNTVRTITETVLRQNGYEVIAVAEGDNAAEVLQFTKPDLIIVGAELLGHGQRPLFEQIQSNTADSPIPMLLLANSGEASLPFPNELIITRPFEPKELIECVNTCLAGATTPVNPSSESLPAGDIEDEMLDAALGLDHIEVTESEVLDQTTGIRVQNVSGKVVGDHIGMERAAQSKKSSDTGRVETIMVPDSDSTNITPSQRPRPKPSETGSLDILQDQFGLEGQPTDRADAGPHDYDWFVNSIQEDNLVEDGVPTDTNSAPAEFTISPNSSILDPHTPPPASAPVKSSGDDKDTGVDEYIDEFRKELENIGAAQPESVVVQPDKPVEPKPSPVTVPVEEPVSPSLSDDQLDELARQFVPQFAEKLAQSILEKLDVKRALKTAAEEFIARTKKG